MIERDVLAAITASRRPLPAVPVKMEPPESGSPRPCYNVGETILFGTLMDQPMKWLVVESTPEKARIVCLECVCEMPYEYRYGIKWEESNIAKWLNGYFAYSAFLPAERKRICEEQITVLREGEVRKYLQSAEMFWWEKAWWVRPDKENDKLPMTLVRPTDMVTTLWNPGIRAGVRPELWLRGEK